ncbi:unnamed protein product [Heterobilharzia americana]|nr:unnamed protein product [Heterobilharzia americana]
MVDYKLKVAPWANPLKTLFSLEGTLRAFIQPVYASDPSNGNSSIVSFHVASSEALSHQTTNRQLNQIHLLINFWIILSVLFSMQPVVSRSHYLVLQHCSVFFSANENTCTHWFNRIRNLLVRISSDLPLLTQIVSDCKDSKDCDTWLKNLKQYGGSTDVLIHLSEALRKLGAWEELKALAQWLDDLFAVERNPFSWLHGICSLTRGHWDKGIEKLNRFLDSNLSKSKIISAENLVTNNVNEFSDQTLSLVYVADVLLQTYISEGDYHSALKLRNRIKSCLKTKTLKQYSAFQLTSARLDCLNKLSEWASTNDVRDNLTTDTSQPWSQNSLRTQLDNLLVNATCSMRKNSDSLHDNSSFMCFSELASIVRQRSASATFLPPLNLFADFYAQSSSVLNGGLLDWLVKAEFLINKQTYASYETSDPINYSSWLHVTPSSSKSHSDAEFSACQWACLNNCPNLAQRLLVRAAKCLTLFDCDISTNKEQKSYFDELCNLALSGSGGIMSKLSQLNTLRFYNYMAKILWLSCDERSQNEHHKKIKAIAILTSGLKLALSENVSCDVIETASQCNLKAEMALTLFEWLESPSNSGNISWAERIHRGFTRSDVSEQKSQRLLCIASDLELFSHLSDVSWCNGTPNITTPFHSTNSSASSSLWTNRLLMMATHLSSNGLSASVWLTMANWCYTRGHKEIHEFQLAARNYIKDINEKSSSHPSVSILLKLVQPKEYTSLTTLVQKLSVSSQENTSDNEGSDLCIPAVISALTTFLASDRCDEDDLELSKHHNTLNTHLHQFSAQCPDDEFDSQIQEKFFSHLHKIIPHLKKSNMTSELTQIVHQLLVSITERQHTLHMSAAQAYATFLTIADQSSVSENPLFSKPICKLDITTTTLKFLDLLCSPSRKLRSMISGFLDQASPVLWEFEQNQCSDEQSIEIKLPSKVKSGSTLGGPAIWEACLPQVLIQLGLPDDMIRNCLVALLNRLIYISTETNVNSKWNSPSYRLAAQLVYPAVVAASNPVAPEIPRSYFKNEGIVSGTVNGRDLESLGDLVEQVEIFTYELKRITVLWEELWLGSLVQHLDELSKKINILESELKRTKHLDVYQNTDHLKVLSTCESSVHLAEEKENSILSLNNSIKNDIEAKLSIYNTEGSVLAYKEFPENIVLAKYIATLQPTLDLLSQLIALTVLVKPETPHEEWFQKTFGHAINELQESLSNPTDPRDVKEPVLLIRQLIEQLQTSHQSTSFSQSHAVSRVGTAVVKLSHNNICYLNLRQLSPRLSSMHFENSHIDTSNRLSCGIPLPGHFGVEASHLGSRITVLPTKTRPKRLLLKAQNGRNYPYLLKGLEDLRLDDRIMRLFELTNLAAVQLASNGSGYSETVIPRPGELFHARLKELLHSSGQEYQPQSRSSWPLDILRKVLNSLEEETPADLLTRELWASNPSCASWWRVTRTFAKSAGLLSSLGYLVGLGDRHLDNLLIDLSTGHIVHIDYNVCFDKGKGLRVAERVPFRLTRILRHPLGPGAQDTLVRGTFRFSAENGLQAARHIADAFLIQLKAFLIDPLVDWQNRKHPTNNSQVVTDFIHLSAFHGGGSTNSCCYRSVSTNRRLRRVDSELRMYSGFLTLRLLELSHSACLDSAFSVLDSVVSRLAVWSEFARARQHASFLNDRYSTLQAATQDDLLSSESHCQQVEQVEQKVKELYEELSKQNDLWMNEILSHFQNYKSLTDPSWLPSLLASSVDLNSPLCTALSNYHSVARIYVNNPAFMDSLTLWIEELKQFHSRMSFLVQSPSADIDLLTAFISSDIPQFISHCDLKISNLLQQTTKKGFSHLCEMRRIKAENLNVIPDYVNSDSTILHEINNLNLFVYDQGTAGIAAYCWALLDYVLNVSDNSLALEIEFKEWSMNSSIYQSENDNLKAFPLDQLTTYTDCLVNLFSVLRHQSTGVWSFSAGYEADVIRELAFLVAVRDSVCCVSQLRANLIRLLVPEAMEALIMANVSVMENFSKFVVHQMTKPGESNLRQLVDDFLKDSVVENQDVQLHQVLVAAHLAFTNTTAQMEEISIRIRSCSVTALAWYYVDIVSQVTNVLMSKSSDWSEGATSLWRWESNTTNNTSESVSSCSWADEVYAAGMMTFISILQDRLTHWRAIHYGSVDKIDDLTLKPFTDPINFYIVRLASRISLPSMVGLASSRLFCALVENTGLSIRRLLIESELSIKASGVVGVLSLSAEKMMESVNVQISLTQPISVQHLKTPASNLIHRLVTRSSQVSQCSVDAIELEAAERHYKHLSLSMSAYNWMHLTQTDKELQLYQQDAPSSLAHVLDSIKHSTTLDCASIETLPDISVNSIASSIHCIETLRSNGLLSYSSFYKCINLITELKKAMEYKEKLTSEFNKLDRIICAVKEAYVLDWPILDWLPSTGGNIEAGNKVNLFGRLESDVNSAECALEELRQRLTLLKQEFIEMCLKSDSLNDDDINQSSSPVIISKRPTRSLHHSRITTLPASQPLVSLSLSSSDISVNAKHPALITSLRSHLSTLQKEKLSDIRQLVKLLSRYDVVRSSLLSSNQMSVGEGCCGVSVWSTWLINHQNWTTDVLNVLKSLSKFITSLSDSNKNSLSDDEMEFATSLNQHCLLVKLKMIEELIIPLLNGIDKHITTNPRLYDTLKGFLLMLNVHFKAMGGTVRNQMNELGMETVESRKTQDAEQVTVSEKSLNIMALSVWNRIYDRLHGFDSSLPTADANKPMSISAQIDACIHEATNVDNLALMYEGWTAWV